MTLQELNKLPREEALRTLLECCGSRAWATRMMRLRPFASTADLLAAADRVWLRLREADWLEAFAAHPRIGERSDSSWSRREQADVETADTETRRALERANAEYEDRFGFTFIVFASGKTPQEILDRLQRRMTNKRAAEVNNAAAEQMKITRLRLQRLFET